MQISLSTASTGISDDWTAVGTVMWGVKVRMLVCQKATGLNMPELKITLHFSFTFSTDLP